MLKIGDTFLNYGLLPKESPFQYVNVMIMIIEVKFFTFFFQKSSYKV